MSEIILNNKMSAEYNLMSVGESCIHMDMIIGNYYENDVRIDFEIRELESSQIKLSYEVTYGGESSITIEYIPVMTSFIGIEYEINPHNLMRVSYDLQLPPIIELTSFPIQDSFVASRNPYAIVNYGKNNSMMVGQDHKGDNVSCIKFDISMIPQGVVIKSAKARMYYSQMANSQIIEMYRIKGNWSEYGITYKNLPPIDVFVTNEYTNNEDDFYIEFDITKEVIYWTDGVINYGLSLKSNDGISVLRTREYPQAPELIVEYYSPTPAVYTSSRIFTEFEVVESSSNSIGIEYDIHSDFRFVDIQLDYFVKAPNDIFDESIIIEYEVFEKTPTLEESTITIEYEISEDLFDFIETEFEIPEYQLESEIIVEFVITDKNSSSIEFEFNVNEYILDSAIEVEFTTPYINDSSIVIEFFAEGYGVEYSSIGIEFNITSFVSSNIEFEFEVPVYDNESTINFEYFTSSYSDSSIFLEFEVDYDEGDLYIDLEFIIVELVISSINIEYEVVVKTASNIELEFGVWGYDDNSIEIEFLPRVEFLDVIEIEFRVKSIPTEKKYYSYVYMI